MNLIKMEDGLPVFLPEARTIKEFARVIARENKLRGKSRNYVTYKKEATKKLAYIWFMEDYKSYYTERYPDDDVARDKEIRKRLDLEDWNALKDKEMLEARAVYAEISDTLELRLLRTARIAANDIIRRLEKDVEKPASDTKFKMPRRDPNEIIKQLKEVSVILDTLSELEKAAKKSEKDGIMYGNKKKNVFEDPIDVR